MWGVRRLSKAFHLLLHCSILQDADIPSPDLRYIVCPSALRKMLNYKCRTLQVLSGRHTMRGGHDQEDLHMVIKRTAGPKGW